MNNLLIIGCGDVALRTIPLLQDHYRLYALVRDPIKSGRLRALGVTPISGDLDNRKSLARIAGLADIVLHLAPPQSASPPSGKISAREADAKDAQYLHDTRTRNLLSQLSTHLLPERLIYISTSGVYGDCGGEIISETRPPNPQSTRAILRINAESQIRAWAIRNRVQASILRVPGIYAGNRLPVDRLHAGTPAINKEEDGYSNHIHADDLARIIIAALRHAKANRIYNTVDDDQMKMGDYFDVVADAFKLSRPPRLTRAEVQRAVSPMMWSFMCESRRLKNERMKRELKIKLRYRTVTEALRERPQ